MQAILLTDCVLTIRRLGIAARGTLLTIQLIAKGENGAAELTGLDDAGGNCGSNGDGGGGFDAGGRGGGGSFGGSCGGDGGGEGDRGAGACSGARGSVPIRWCIAKTFTGGDAFPALCLDEAKVV